jgi:hypothetical protein
MAFESTRKTKAAIVEETTEGTPVSPSSGNDYTALQDGFSMEPNFDTIENAELRGSIATAEPVQGLESPTASKTHYFRHSGVEAQAPDYSLILKSLFGAETINSTERTTTTGSTAGDADNRAVVELAAGGTDFATRGVAMLIKDGTNGYSVRNAYSQSSESITMAFNLANAPATGIDTGKSVYYTMTDAGVPVTLWNYLGDGGAIQMLAGAKVDSGTFNFPAAEAINLDASFLGTRYYYNPIEITSSDIYLDFTSDNGTFAATVSAKMYRDPDELATALTDSMNTADNSETYLVTYSSSTGKFTISSSTSTLLSLLWSSGTNTANTIGDKLGFTITSDDTGATTYTSDNEQDWSSPYAPTLDSESFLVAKASELLVGSYDDYVCLSNSNVTVNFGKEASDVLDACQESGKASTLFNGRPITVDVSGYIQKHDVSKWLAFKDNTTQQFAYTAGRKSGGNWVAGSVVNLFSPTAKISSLAVEDNDGVLALSFTLSVFGDGTNNELVCNFL